jgi:phage terminase large subunit-like protein
MTKKVSPGKSKGSSSSSKRSSRKSSDSAKPSKASVKSKAPRVRKVAAKWIRGSIDLVAIKQGCWFDESAGKRACAFIETFCCQSHGKAKGQPIKLVAWQRDFIMRLFGWKTKDGLRRYRRAYVEIAKKNGKSTLISALVLFLLLADGEGSPEIYLNACDKDQAGIVFREAARMVKASQDLKSRLKIINSKADMRILDEEGEGVIVANSSVAGSKDGLNPSGCIFDELHRQQDRALWSVFEHADAARDQPLTISITTAGEAPDGVWYEQREYSEGINNGEIDDITHLGIIFRALPEDDHGDPKTWLKANPSLGVTLKYEELARKWKEASRDPVKRANFLRLRLNIIQREELRFFNVGQWEACGAPVQVEPGSACWCGLDLSSTNDLTALVGIFKNDLDGFDVLAWFWLPEDNILDLEQKHKRPYRTWADMGLITLTDGPSVDYRFIRQQINKIAKLYSLQKFLADPKFASHLLTELQEEDGLEVHAIQQNVMVLGPATFEFKRLVESKALRHGSNPILDWMAGNLVPVYDTNNNVRFTKKKQKNKIDGIAALINALAGTMDRQSSNGSAYDGGGILFL